MSSDRNGSNGNWRGNSSSKLLSVLDYDVKALKDDFEENPKKERKLRYLKFGITDLCRIFPNEGFLRNSNYFIKQGRYGQVLSSLEKINDKLSDKSKIKTEKFREKFDSLRGDGYKSALKEFRKYHSPCSVKRILAAGEKRIKVLLRNEGLNPSVFLELGLKDIEDFLKNESDENDENDRGVFSKYSDLIIFIEGSTQFNDDFSDYELRYDEFLKEHYRGTIERGIKESQLKRESEEAKAKKIAEKWGYQSTVETKEFHLDENNWSFTGLN